MVQQNAFVVLKDKSYQNRLSALGIDTLQPRSSIFALIEVFKIVYNLSLQFSDSFLFDANKITCGHQCKLFKQRFQLNVRKFFFFFNRVVNLWNRLPSHIACAASVL